MVHLLSSTHLRFLQFALPAQLDMHVQQPHQLQQLAQQENMHYLEIRFVLLAQQVINALQQQTHL